MISFNTKLKNKSKVTPNGFTVTEEKRLLRAVKITEEDIRKGKAEEYTNIDEALAALKK